MRCSKIGLLASENSEKSDSAKPFSKNLAISEHLFKLSLPFVLIVITVSINDHHIVEGTVSRDNGKKPRL